MEILVLNFGSSSLKFQFFLKKDLPVLAAELIEQIGDEDSAARLSYVDFSL